MVYRSLAPPSILKNSGEAAKDRTARNVLHYDNASSHTANATIAFLEKTPVKLNYSSSLQSRPGPVRIFLVPEHEESHMRTLISQLRTAFTIEGGGVTVSRAVAYLEFGSGGEGGSGLSHMF